MTQAKLAQLKKFFSQFPTQKFAKNSIFLKPGDPIENVYFNKSGFGRAFTKTNFGENTFSVFKPLFMVSMMHYFTKSRNDLYFQALTSAEAYVVPKTDFKKYLIKNPEMESIIMDYFFSSLLRYLSNQGNLINGTAISKVASVLFQLVHDYGDIKKDIVVVSFPATHRIIANIVGLTRETTSVQMSKLQKLGVIATKRTKFHVMNLEKLRNLAFVGK